MLTKISVVNPSIKTRTGKELVELSDRVTLFVGPNGSGKSTLLKAVIDQLEGNTTGTPLVNLTRDNTVPFLFHASESQVKAETTTSRLGGSYLSHGQRLMQSLRQLNSITEPHTILLDEPEMALDVDSVIELGKLILNTPHQYLIATHSPLLYLLPKVGTVVFGSDSKYYTNVVKSFTKLLAKKTGA